MFNKNFILRSYLWAVFCLFILPSSPFFNIVIIKSKRILNSYVILRVLESTVMIRIIPSTSPNLPQPPPTSPILPLNVNLVVVVCLGDENVLCFESANKACAVHLRNIELHPLQLPA